jgi:hypothetical protein
MENINEFKNDDDNKISFRDKVRLIKLNNPGKFDHLPDPVKKPQNWSEEGYQLILKTLREKKYKDDERN